MPTFSPDFVLIRGVDTELSVFKVWLSASRAPKPLPNKRKMDPVQLFTYLVEGAKTVFKFSRSAKMMK
jgi:hypothetical protein